MPITFAAAVSHVPGMTAWADAAPVAQKDRVYRAFDRLRQELDASQTDTLIVLTSEHWANFFLDHIGAFCVGRAETYSGPVEPWLKIEKTNIKGEPKLAAELIDAAYDSGIEPGRHHGAAAFPEPAHGSAGGPGHVQHARRAAAER
jgi:hypothetical protein